MTKRTNEGTWATVNRLSVELCIEHHDRLSDLILFLHAHRDSFASVQHRSMISTPRTEACRARRSVQRRDAIAISDYEQRFQSGPLFRVRQPCQNAPKP